LSLDRRSIRALPAVLSLHNPDDTDSDVAIRVRLPGAARP
jgi:hypothetical protein